MQPLHGSGQVRLIQAQNPGISRSLTHFVNGRPSAIFSPAAMYSCSEQLVVCCVRRGRQASGRARTFFCLRRMFQAASRKISPKKPATAAPIQNLQALPAVADV